MTRLRNPRSLRDAALVGLAAMFAAASSISHARPGELSRGAVDDQRHSGWRALAVLMIGYLVRGSWTEALHMPLTAAALTMPIAGILFVPVLIGIPWLYPWRTDAAARAIQNSSI